MGGDKGIFDSIINQVSKASVRAMNESWSWDD